MYTHEDLWPIKCPRCFHEFTQHIGRMEAGDRVRCPSCSLDLPHSREQFGVALAQARAGAFDPWRDMMSIERPV